jgi:hypothetical protein
MAIYTPKQTEKTLNYFNRKCKYQFTDVSWGNDSTDSIGTEGLGLNIELDVYLPNAKKENLDKMHFNTYTIRINSFDEELNQSVERIDFKTATEVIKYINENL